MSTNSSFLTGLHITISAMRVASSADIKADFHLSEVSYNVFLFYLTLKAFLRCLIGTKHFPESKTLLRIHNTSQSAVLQSRHDDDSLYFKTMSIKAT